MGQKPCGTSTELGIPKVLVVNGLDREHTKFSDILNQAKERFGKKCLPNATTCKSGPGFNQIVDVLRRELITYQTDGSGKFSEDELPEDLVSEVDGLHSELIEYVAESDDSLLEKYFDQGNLSEEEMRGGIHHAIQNQVFIPMFCVSAENNIGVARLCDFIAKYGASPDDRKTVKAINSKEEEIDVSLDGKETVIQIFKTMAESHVGELSLFRVYSGSVKTGSDLFNTNRNSSERMGQLFILNGKNRTQIDKVSAGDIGAVVKLKDTHTGNTLCSGDRVKMPKLNLPNSNIHAAISSTTKGDEEKLAIGLSTLHEEDPTFIYRVDSEIRQTIISGQGELHLQVSTERLKEGLILILSSQNLISPIVKLLIAKLNQNIVIKSSQEVLGSLLRYGCVLSLNKEGRVLNLLILLVGQNVDRVFIPSVEKGVNTACENGIIAGCRVVDVKIDFYDGKMHPVDSKDIAFQTAGKNAFIDAFKSAKPCLLEPITNIEVKVPEEYMGDIMGDISGKRGKILGMDSDGSFQLIKAQVPTGRVI